MTSKPWCISKAWNDLVNSNVLWLAQQVAKYDVAGPSSLRLLAIEETLELVTLKFDIWE
jgi:hypothetical protein